MWPGDSHDACSARSSRSRPNMTGHNMALGAELRTAPVTAHHDRQTQAGSPLLADWRAEWSTPTRDRRRLDKEAAVKHAARYTDNRVEALSDDQGESRRWYWGQAVRN